MCVQACVHVSVCECLEATLPCSGNNKDSPSTAPQYSKQIGLRHGMCVNVCHVYVHVCVCVCVCVWLAHQDTDAEEEFQHGVL